MFKKLLSNLPFNPSLIGQVAFYAKRVRREEMIRRTGLVFVVLALFVQIFAVVSPPEPTLAQSPNDIVRGGFTTREQAVNYCRTNLDDFANILAYYQVTCEMLATAATKSINSLDEGKKLDSLGRIAQGPKIARTGKPTEEYSLSINKNPYYMKNLWAWDSGSSSTYKVLEAKNKNGVIIRVMYICGNIVTVGQYTPPLPPKPPSSPKPPEIPDVCPKIPNKQTSKEECDVCPNVGGEQSEKSQCYPCPEAKNDTAITVCLELHKTAANQTQNIPDANGTMAAANDVIIYTLSVKNKGDQTVKDFVVQENISDILEYADLIDINSGDIDVNNTIRWAKLDIAAGATIQKQITAKVKSPVPQTPASVSDPSSFDLVMTNVFYGDTVQIKLPPSVTKTTEQVVLSLPSTGPGSTIASAFVITVFASYFFARSRLMGKELDIVRADFTSTGGAS